MMEAAGMEVFRLVKQIAKIKAHTSVEQVKHDPVLCGRGGEERTICSLTALCQDASIRT